MITLIIIITYIHYQYSIIHMITLIIIITYIRQVNI